MIFLTFLTAIALSGIAAYYSVLGLTAIFVGTFWPVVLMGSTLEIAKLVTASWLYRNWKIAPFLLKTYLTISVLILMLITSMGIFGFLSKAHIDSTLNYGTNQIELKVLTEQETNIKDRLNYLLARAKDPSTASHGLDRQIQSTQRQLTEIVKKKLPLLKTDTKLSADVGPVKYVAELIYGNDENGIDKAVRLVIIVIMLVFDPLAVLLLIAGNISLKNNDNNDMDDMDDEVKEFFDKGKELAKKLDANEGFIPDVNINHESNNIPLSENNNVINQIAPGLYTEEKANTMYDYKDELTFKKVESKFNMP